MTIEVLLLLMPILLFFALGCLIRWMERRDWKAAQEEARILMALTHSRPPVSRSSAAPMSPTRNEPENSF